jgi:acetyl esterase/lipase
MNAVGLSVLSLVVLIAALARAEDKKPEEKIAATFEAEVVKNVAYYEGEGADKIRHKLDLYLPKGQKDYPVFFFIHGGGWTDGCKNGFADHGKTFAKNGIGFVAINYRLSARRGSGKEGVKHPAHIEDVVRAFAWVIANFGKRGANVDQIYVSGHSAGGHLCALLATDESYLKTHKLSLKDIKGVVPISGVFRVGGSADPEVQIRFGDKGKEASPLTYVKEGLPPFLIFYADKEIAPPAFGDLGKQAEQFGKALQKVKSQVVVKMIKDRNHDTIMGHAAKPDDELTVAVFEFIRKKGVLPERKEKTAE